MRRLWLVCSRRGGIADVAGLVTLTIVMTPRWVGAAEYSVVPRASLEAVYNDNRRLRADSAKDAVGGIVSVGGDLAVRTEVSELRLTPRVRFARYSGDTSLDNDDQFLDGTLATRSERSEWRIDGSYDRDTTLTTEIDDTGRLDENRRRIRWDVKPSWTYSLTERTSTRLGYEYSDVHYRRKEGTSLVDYAYQTADAALTHQLTERDELSGTLFWSKFDAEDIPNKSDQYGFIGGYARDFSETLRGTLSLGVRQADLTFRRDGRTRKSNKTGFLADVGLIKKFEVTTVDANLSRSVNPSGSGFLIQRDQLEFGVARKLNEKLTARLVGRAFRNKSLDNAVDSADRKYGRIETRLRWKFSERWALIGAYSYTRQKFDNTSSSADANAVSLMLEYEGRKMAVSR